MFQPVMLVFGGVEFVINGQTLSTPLNNKNFETTIILGPCAV